MAECHAKGTPRPQGRPDPSIISDPTPGRAPSTKLKREIRRERERREREREDRTEREERE